MTLPEQLRAQLASPVTLRALRAALAGRDPAGIAAVVALAPATLPEFLTHPPRSVPGGVEVSYVAAAPRPVPGGHLAVAPVAAVRGCVEARAPSALAHYDRDPPAGGVRVVVLDAGGGVAVASLPVRAPEARGSA